MIISKKKFERLVEERVCEIMRERERERFADERHYELEKRFKRQNDGLWCKITEIERRLDNIEGHRPTTDYAPKIVANCERL